MSVGADAWTGVAETAGFDATAVGRGGEDDDDDDPPSFEALNLSNNSLALTCSSSDRFFQKASSSALCMYDSAATLAYKSPFSNMKPTANAEMTLPIITAFLGSGGVGGMGCDHQSHKKKRETQTKTTTTTPITRTSQNCVRK